MKRKTSFPFAFYSFIRTFAETIKTMKLKFTIRYRTAWGESLHVALQLYSKDGTVRQQNYMMQTDDGELWTP